jgi:hypothetical protein
MSAAGHIGAVEVIECAGDGEAGRRALRMLAKHERFDAIEVWDRDRMVSH